MNIGSLRIWPNVVLAPMAGITAHPFASSASGTARAWSSPN
jgi:tRNA-dihydrouridine synthase